MCFIFLISSFFTVTSICTLVCGHCRNGSCMSHSQKTGLDTPAKSSNGALMVPYSNPFGRRKLLPDCYLSIGSDVVHDQAALQWPSFGSYPSPRIAQVSGTCHTDFILCWVEQKNLFLHWTLKQHKKSYLAQLRRCIQTTQSAWSRTSYSCRTSCRKSSLFQFVANQTWYDPRDDN